MKPQRNGITLGLSVVLAALIGLGLGYLLRRPATKTTRTAREPTDTELRRTRELREVARAIAAANHIGSPPASPTSGDTSAPSRSEAPQEVAAETERRAHVDRLRASGDAPNEFRTFIDVLGRQWSEIARSENWQLQTGEWECFRAGCFSTMTVKRGAPLEVVGVRLADSESARSWPGASFRSGPIPSATGIEITWVFFAPEPDSMAQISNGTKVQ